MSIREGGREERRERNKPSETLNDREQNEGCWREEEQGMGQISGGIKEDTYCDEHWVSYVRDESLNSIPKTSIAK